MKNAIRTLVTTTVLWGATGHGQTLPEWLQDSEEYTSQADAPESESSQTSTAEPKRAPAELGPLLEEYGVTPRHIETVDERNAREAAARAETAAAPESPPLVLLGVDALYGVQPSDVLQISVWREPELQREVAVSPDGRINYPLIGSLAVEGKSVDQIGTEIEAGLTRYMKQAAVTVSVKEALGSRIYVLGQVNRPGAFPYSKSLDVVQALSLAGGAAKFAALGNIKILRRVEGVPRAFEFDYAQVQKGQKLDQNILLENGDVIMVP